ncbi:hypothetical protein D3C77_677350 [compost metagenome]
MLAVTANAGLQRTDELVIGPCTDAGLRVRGNVGRKQRAERQLELNTTGEGLTARHGMASHTVGSARQVFALSQQVLLRIGRLRQQSRAGERQ